MEANEKIPKFIHPLKSFSCDDFHTGLLQLQVIGVEARTLGMVSYVIPKARLDNPNVVLVAVFSGMNRSEMFSKAGYRVRPINRSCKPAL